MLTKKLSLMIGWLLLFISFSLSAEAQSSRVKKSKEICSVETTRDDLDHRREEIQKLVLSGQCAHEGATELMEIGNIDSVPVLLKILRDSPGIKRTNGRVRVSSTAMIATAALQRITGVAIGVSYEQWNEWWQTSKKYYEQP